MSMRIACVHVPQLGLQCATRSDPSLRGAAVAVVGSGLEGSIEVPRASARVSIGSPSARVASPIVQACSRAAWALGVRLGMTATSARALSPDLQVVAADAALERETVRAIADVMLAASPLVDSGGRVGIGGAHLAMYCEVPTRTRGQSFGDRLLERLDALGITARIGIADDRFTAWVAAAHGHDGEAHDHDVGVISVPRGGSPAFLSPRSLSLLAIAPEVQHMLEALGVRTLGEFAALPAPTVGRPIDRLGGGGIDYQALARGDSGHVLRPYAPEAPIREEVAITPAVSGPAAIAAISRRIAMRLEGRGRGARRIEVTALGEAGEKSFAIGERGALASAGDIADALGAAGVLNDPLWRLRVVVTGEVVDAAEPAAPAAPDVLAVVLATPGAGDLFAPRPSIEREGRRHQGFRRSKQRRRAVDRALGLAQTKLFRTHPA
jgi:protein ImuB